MSIRRAFQIVTIATAPDCQRQNWRMTAFDLPWHGKSLPPEGWQKEEYRLTTAGYTEMIVAFCRALELHRSVVMGHWRHPSPTQAHTATRYSGAHNNR